MNIINTYYKEVRNVEVMYLLEHDMEENFIERDSNTTAFVRMFALARRARVSLFIGRPAYHIRIIFCPTKLELYQKQFR